MAAVAVVVAAEGGGGRPHRDIAAEIRRRIAMHMRARAGYGSSVLTGDEGTTSALESRLAQIASVLENLTINLTLNNNIDGHAVSSAITRHQVRRLQTFV